MRLYRIDTVLRNTPEEAVLQIRRFPEFEKRSLPRVRASRQKSRLRHRFCVARSSNMTRVALSVHRLRYDHLNAVCWFLRTNVEPIQDNNANLLTNLYFYALSGF